MALDTSKIKGYTGYAAYRNPNNKNQIIWFMVYNGNLLSNGKYYPVTENWLNTQLAKKYKNSIMYRAYDAQPRQGYQVGSAVVPESMLTERKENQKREKLDGSMDKVTPSATKPKSTTTEPSQSARPATQPATSGAREQEDTDECSAKSLGNYIATCEKLVIPQLGGSMTNWAKNQDVYLTNFNKASKCLNSLMGDLDAMEYYKFKNRIERLRNYYTEYSTKSLLVKDPTQMR